MGKDAGAARYRARAELRRRWKATVALVLLVGLAGGAVLTTVAGARRTSSAYERFRRETLAGDVDITPGDPDRARFAAMGRLPQVEVVGRTAFPFIRSRGTDLYPYLEFLVAVGPDGELGYTIDRPRVLRGRMPDQDRPDELAVIEVFAEEADLGVGDRVSFESYTPDQFEDLFSGAAVEVQPAGPVVDLTVTGVVAAPDFLSESAISFDPRAILSPAFVSEYGDRIGVYEVGGRARLRRGAEDAPAFVDAVRRIYRDDPELEIQLAGEITDRIEDTFGVLVVALVLCAACAGLAGVATVGQALSRHLAQSSTADQPVLAGLGMSRDQRMLALVETALPVAVGGALVAVAVAIAASPLMPVGVARRAEPDRGISVDGTVLATGFVAIVALVTAMAWLGAWRASRSVALADPGRRRPSTLSRLLRASGARPAATIGARMALEPGRGRAAVPVRSAVAGIVTGVVGLVAVIVFATSLSALLDDSGRYGFPWDAYVPGFGVDLVDEHGADLAADPDVRDLGTVTSGLARIGDEDLPVYAFEARKGSVSPTLLEGRLAAGDDEVVLGSDTLRELSAEVGDTVEISGPQGSVRLRIVGRAAFPFLDERSAVANGAALTPRGVEPLLPPESFNRGLLVSWARGIDQEAANRGLEERTGAQVLPAALPADVGNLERVEALPRALAAFLALLAALALAHTLVTTVRRRRRDLAVLRTFGFVRSQVSATVVWQAATLAVTGLVLGIPLGVAAGRAAWGLVADGIGVVNAPAAPVLGLGLVGLAALALALLVAASPAREATRIRPAVVLRSE